MTFQLNINLRANGANPTSTVNKAPEKRSPSRLSKGEFDRFLLQCFLIRGDFSVTKIQVLSSGIVCIPDPQNLKPTASNFLSLTHAVACNAPFKKGIAPPLIAEKMANRMNPAEKAKCLTTLAIINGDLGLNMRAFSYPFFYTNSFDYPHHSSVQEILEEAKKISNLLLAHPVLRNVVPYLNALSPPEHIPILNEWLKSIEKRLEELRKGHTVLFSKYQFFYQKTSGRILATWHNIPLSNFSHVLKYSPAFDAIPAIEISDKSNLPEFLCNVPCVALQLEVSKEIPLFTGRGYVPYSPVCSVIYDPQYVLEEELVNLTNLPTVIGQTVPVAELEQHFLIGRVHPLVGINSGFPVPQLQQKQVMDLEMLSNLLPKKQDIFDQPDFERVSDQPQSHPNSERKNWANSFNNIQVFKNYD